MLVRADGTFLGTVGGGCLEAEVYEAAKEVIRDEKTRTLSFRLTDFESPIAEPIFYYLVRARNLCPDGLGTLGTTANQVLRTGKDCYP